MQVDLDAYSSAPHLRYWVDVHERSIDESAVARRQDDDDGHVFAEARDATGADRAYNLVTIASHELHESEVVNDWEHMEAE